MSMKQIGPLWFPEEEQHFLQYEKDITGYQKKQRDFALHFVRSHELALDVGAHVGIFSRHFAQHFEHVIAFEPIANLRECIALNTPSNVQVWPCAVSDKVGHVKMLKLSTVNSGCSFFWDDDRVYRPRDEQEGDEIVEVPATTIDDMQLSKPVGLIKIDVQGSDHLVLEGARRTILRDKPVVMVEEKTAGGPGDSIRCCRKIMHDLGYFRSVLVGADRVYIP